MQRTHQLVVASAFSAALVAACLVSPERDERATANGAALYALHCAVCHGPSGAGDGQAASLLLPPPRDFTRAEFRLVSTANHAPSQADLVATLRRGIPGSAMPAWSWMSEAELDALATQVRTLARDGLAQRELALAEAEGAKLDLAQARARADERLAPGEPVHVPRPQPAIGEVERLGRESYLRHCAACHGSEGRGEQLGPERNPDGSPNWARDFTAGFVKGGASHRALATRLVTGMPGTTMPSFAALPAPELEALATYVSGLVAVDADRWLVHRQATLVARRAAGAASLSDGVEPSDERWGAAAEIDVVLAPLAWRNDALVSAKLAALHDGESLALRVRWRDATRDEGSIDPAERRDGAALAFSNESAPPLFGMGASSHPVNLWHWRSQRLIDRAGVLDLLDAQPHALGLATQRDELSDVRPHYLPAPSEPVAGGQLAELSAESFSAMRELGESGRAVAASARWEGGEWSVVFVRELAPRTANEVDLRLGRSVLAALALWDGAGGDVGGHKSFSIWQKIAVE
jgi:mono/diheme cytochrome c family protein